MGRTRGFRLHIKVLDTMINLPLYRTSSQLEQFNPVFETCAQFELTKAHIKCSAT